MKSLFILGSTALLCLQSYAQFTIQGTVKKQGDQNVLYVRPLSLDFTNDPIDSIIITEGKSFSQTLKIQTDHDLFKMSTSPGGTMPDFPENAIIFNTTTNGILELEIPSLQELYNTRIIKGSEANRHIATRISQPLSEFFKLMSNAGSIQTEGDRNTLLEQVTGFQQKFLHSLQTNVLGSDEPAVMLTGLYFLALLQKSTGQDVFSSYYHTVSSSLPLTSLKSELEKISNTPGIKVKDLLGLQVKDQNDHAEKKLEDLIQTEYAILDFWASWCGPCRKVNTTELPSILKQLRGSTKVSFISVSVDGNEENWKNALRQDKISWDTYRVQRTDQSYLPDFLNGNGVPLYLLVSRNGELLFSTSGFDVLKERIRQL